jgi:hypothetical protein
MYNCKRCGVSVETKFGSGVFCSRACANSRERTEEVKRKISQAIKSCDAYKAGRFSLTKGTGKTVDKTCPLCSKTFTVSAGSIKKFCSKACVYKNPLIGGYREGSGRSKSGWYKGIYCNSTWELAFLIYHLDNNLPIKRCTETFPYTFEGRKRSYLPDFVVGDAYIEIKGYHTSQSMTKIEQFPHKISVYAKAEMEHIFDYVKDKYGNDFIELYEGNPHNMKKNSCGVCGNPCKIKYCSKSCSMKGNHISLVAQQGAAPCTSL